MMTIYKFFAAIGVILAILGLSACGGGMGESSFESTQQWSNYKCYASDSQGGKQHTGWAPDSSRARSIALEKCQSQGSRGCRIIGCAGE